MRSMRCLILGVLSGLIAPATPAWAGLTLTPAATTAGFQLTTFASGFPNSGTNGIGPLGVAFTNAGNILVGEYWTSSIASFATDTDGQTYASASIASGSYSYAADGLTKGLDGTIYLASYLNDAVYALNNDGTLNHTVATNLGNVDGIVTNPVTGMLYVSSTNGVLVINPSNGNVTTLTTGFTGVTDGLTFSPDGTTLYAAVGNSVEGIKLSNPTTLIFNSSVSTADGTALGTGSLAGNIFVNTNSGNVYEINLTSGVQTLLASGGSRGDFVQVNPNNGSLLLTQTDSIMRLTAPAGGGFGSAVPEPASLLMTLNVIPMILAFRRRLLKLTV